MNFSWSFSGGSDGVLGILWGLKKDGGNAFINNRVLVSLKPSRSPAFFPIALSKGYKERVSGSLTGNKFSGQAIFTLSSIRKSDERFYGCKVESINSFESPDFDHLYLLVSFF